MCFNPADSVCQADRLTAIAQPPIVPRYLFLTSSFIYPSIMGERWENDGRTMGELRNNERT